MAETHPERSGKNLVGHEGKNHKGHAHPGDQSKKFHAKVSHAAPDDKHGGHSEVRGKHPDKPGSHEGHEAHRKPKSPTTAILLLGLAILLIVAALWLPSKNTDKTEDSSAARTIKEGLADIKSGASQVTKAWEIDLKGGQNLTQQDVAEGVGGGLNAYDVAFSCQDPGFCAFDKLVVYDDSVYSKVATHAFVAVCGDKSRLTPPKYCVALSRSGNSAVNDCIIKCGLR